jgi:VanZ family protein
VLSVAGIDELRQATLASRTGSLADVALDLTGGAIGVLLIVALHRWLGVGAPAREEP